MKAIIIESGVPLPPKQGKPEMGEIRDTLTRMQIGQSFTCQTQSSCVLRTAHRLGIPITTRKLHKGGWRVWRIDADNASNSDQRCNADVPTSPASNDP